MTDDERGRGAAVIPAVDSPGSLATVRSLGRRGVHTVAVSELARPPTFASRYCEERRTVPDPHTDLDGYRDALLSLAAREDVRSIVPVREPDVHVLATHRGAFAEHLRTPWPTFEQLTAVHDRVALFAAAERAGVSVPETALLDAVESWDRERIVKGRYALLTPDRVDSVPAGRCEPPPKTAFLDPGIEPDVEALVDRMGHVPVAQAYVDGTEYCFRAFCRDGEPLATSQKRLVRGYKYARGPSVYHEAVDRPELDAAGRALLAELDWEGMASVGFIEDEDGTFRLLEVNPRIPASLPVDVHAGVDYPAHHWAAARGDHGRVDDDYRPGTASHHLRGECAHLHSVLREDYPLVERPSLAGTAGRLAASLVEHPRFDILSLDDPVPFARAVGNAARTVASRR